MLPSPTLLGMGSADAPGCRAQISREQMQNRCIYQGKNCVRVICEPRWLKVKLQKRCNPDIERADAPTAEMASHMA
jgi:hypothetical protein